LVAWAAVSFCLLIIGSALTNGVVMAGECLDLAILQILRSQLP
jgi:hypothetical protein